jgi:RiboL-PSP-HEPN
MNLADIRAELEDELRWRLEELRFLKNQLPDLRTDDERSRFRRALVVMLYSHFEGFWKAAFSIYVKALNAEGILCKDALHNLVAATLFDLLAGLTDHQKKHSFFRSKAPDDTKLHQLHRQIEFLSRLPELGAVKLDIPVEKVVDPESNLKPDVIRKNLFRLGFPHDLFEPHEGTVHQLLNKRNNVAHGATRLGIAEDEFNRLEGAVLSIMEDVIKLLFDWLRTRKYLKNP